MEESKPLCLRLTISCLIQSITVLLGVTFATPANGLHGAARFFLDEFDFRHASREANIILAEESFEESPFRGQPFATPRGIGVQLSLPGNTRVNNEIARFATHGSFYLESETLRSADPPYVLTFTFPMSIHAFAVDLIDFGTALDIEGPDPKSMILRTDTVAGLVLNEYTGAVFNVVTVGFIDTMAGFSRIAVEVPGGGPEDFFAYDRIQYGRVAPEPFSLGMGLLMMIVALLLFHRESARGVRNMRRRYHSRGPLSRHVPGRHPAGFLQLEQRLPLSAAGGADWNAATNDSGPAANPPDTSCNLPTLLAGDYDGSGVVDDSDYSVWKSQFGNTVEPGTGADGSGDGFVDAADYTVWRDNQGRGLSLRGDYDRNGTIDNADYDRWHTDFGLRVEPGLGADGNADGIIDALDYSVWRDNLETTGAPARILYVDQQHPLTDDAGPGLRDAPWSTIRRAADVARPGDLVVVRAGTYVETSPHDIWNIATLNPVNSGTAERPLTFRAYPGEDVLVSNDEAGYPAIGNSGIDFIDWIGFRTDRHAALFNTIGSELAYLDVVGRYVSTPDNHDGIRIENTDSVLIHHNSIHGVTGDSPNSAGIKVYTSSNLIVEDNHLFGNTTGVFDKDTGVNNTYRRNYFTGNELAFQGNNQGEIARYLIYDNVFTGLGTSGSVHLLIKNDGSVIRNNLIFADIFSGTWVGDVDTLTQIHLWDNVIVSPSESSIAWFQGWDWTGNEFAYFDHNVYTSPPIYSTVSRTDTLFDMRQRGYELASAVAGELSEIYSQSWELQPAWWSAGRFDGPLGPQDVALVLDVSRYGPPALAPDPAPDPAPALAPDPAPALAPALAATTHEPAMAPLDESASSPRLDLRGTAPRSTNLAAGAPLREAQLTDHDALPAAPDAEYLSPDPASPRPPYRPESPGALSHAARLNYRPFPLGNLSVLPSAWELAVDGHFRAP
jgi:hypothetical protein